MPSFENMTKFENMAKIREPKIMKWAAWNLTLSDVVIQWRTKTWTWMHNYKASTIWRPKNV